MPDVKLIVILRNPVDCAYSHYQMKVRNKIELLSFEEAIEAEEKRGAEAKEQLIKNSDLRYSVMLPKVNFLVVFRISPEASTPNSWKTGSDITTGTGF